MTVMAPILDDIRKAIQAGKTSRYALAKQTGLSQAHLCQFMAGTKGLSVEAAERLAECLGLEITVRKRKQRKGR